MELIEQMAAALAGMIADAEHLESDEHITACQCRDTWPGDVVEAPVCHYCTARAVLARVRLARKRPTPAELNAAFDRGVAWARMTDGNPGHPAPECEEQR